MTSNPRTAARKSARRHAALVAVAIAAAIGACTEVGTDPDAAVSLAFDTLSLPARAVVRGDTMRDTSGAATPLVARAFNADGGVIPDAPIAFLYVPADSSDSARAAVTIENGYVIAQPTAPTGLTYRVVAQIGSLQSQAVRFGVVPRPDAAEPGPAVPTDTADTVVHYGNPKDTLAILRLRVLHDSVDAASGLPVPVPVPSYLVQFKVDSSAPAVVDSVQFVTGQQRSNELVTQTDNAGVAIATMRVFVKAVSSGAADSIVVKGYVNYGGPPTPGPLRGSPVRMMVRLEPSFAAAR